MKSKLIAYLLWFFLGIFSAHRFYLGHVGIGIFYLITGQLFGIGWIIDLFILSGLVDKYNLMYGFSRPNNTGSISQNVNVNVNVPSHTDLSESTEKK